MQLEKQLDPKFKREGFLANLLRRKIQKQAETLLQEAAVKNQDLVQGLKHNQFGAFCLQSHDLEKAEKHLLKAKQLIEKTYPFSNVYMNMGNLYAQKKDYESAIKWYQQVVKKSPYQEGFQNIYGEVIFCGKLNSHNAFVDAHTNMAVMLVQTDKVEEGLRYCQKALEMDPNNTQAQINFTDFLRQVGRKDQAIKHTWDQIILYTQKNKDPNYKGFDPIKIKPWKSDIKHQGLQQKTINVLSVKWGTRYDADYVNKLYASIKRNTTWKTTFYCFTDDPKGLHQDICAIQLEKGWTKWWGKITLFGCNIPGRKFYIDLDMVITGSLDEVFSYEGEFVTLRTDDLVCEKNHKGGYNSSVMIWQGDMLKPVYQILKQNFDVISKFIVRFDFWLEMTILNADFMQVVYPGIVVDYLLQCQVKPPETSSIVCFARKPKPQDYPAEWIRQYWVQ